MKQIFFIFRKLLLIMLLLSAAQCEDNDSKSLNMTLYDQPLSTIQSIVEGKWKWIEHSICGIVGSSHPSNTVVHITKDHVFTTGDLDGLNQAFSFSYVWKKMSTPTGDTAYVMWNNEQNKGEWYFDSIQNDSLNVYSYSLDNCGHITIYLFKHLNSL